MSVVAAAANGNNVVISINNAIHVVTLIFNGNVSDSVKSKSETLIAGSGIEVLNKKGKTPMGRNMFALLNCHGGTLKYDGITYTVQVEEGKFAGILYGHVYMNEKEKILIELNNSKENETERKRSIERPEDRGANKKLKTVGEHFCENEIPAWNRTGWELLPMFEREVYDKLANYLYKGDYKRS
jgi:hypothetical protein